MTTQSDQLTIAVRPDFRPQLSIGFANEILRIDDENIFAYRHHETNFAALSMLPLRDKKASFDPKRYVKWYFLSIF